MQILRLTRVAMWRIRLPNNSRTDHVMSGRARASGVSSSSFFDLQAEISKRKEDFNKSKAAGTARPIFGAEGKDKKQPVWNRSNKGVNERNARDIQLEAIDKPTLENAKAALERKALIYEKLRKGKTGGLSESQYDSLLVDFDQPQYGSDSESDVDESLTLPSAPKEESDDPVVEYEDEFGRVRTAKRSEVPRNLPKQSDLPASDDREIDPFAIYGDQQHFPVFQQDEETIRKVEEAYEEASKDPTQHYDAARDNRAMGAGFYQFSADEATRQKQMEELKIAREETERVRALDETLVAQNPDVASSSDAVQQDEPPAGPRIAGRGVDKRKRELEERRKAIAAKRQKTKGNDVQAADDFLANLEASLGK